MSPDEHDVERALLGIEPAPERRLDEADPPAQIVQRHAAEPAAEHAGGAVARPRLRRGDPQQRRLPGAVRADDPPVLALRGRPVDPVEDDLADAVRGPPEADLARTRTAAAVIAQRAAHSTGLHSIAVRFSVGDPGSRPSPRRCLRRTASAKLTPAEQKWAAPLVQLEPAERGPAPRARPGGRRTAR